MSTLDLPTLARSQDHDQLEQAWQESLSEPREVSSYTDALKALCDTASLGVAIKLGTQAIDALVEKGRRGDAIKLGTTLVRGGALSDGLARRLFELIEAEFGSQDWYALAVSESGISAENLTNEAFKRFDKVRLYTVGNVVYHRAGWGEGLIEKFDSTTRELEVRFASGSVKEFPLSTALDSLRPLDDADLRAMRLKATEELERLAAEEPAVLIRKAVQLYRGTATSAQVKTELAPSVIPTKKWATFWKKAKAAAANDPWLLIEGSSSRPTFVLRSRPVSLTEEAERMLTHSEDLGEAIAICRDYFARGLDSGAQQAIVELARGLVEKAIEANQSGQGKESHAHLLDGILFLEENGASASMSAAEELAALLTSGEDGAFEFAKLDELQTQKSKEHAVRLIDKAFPDDWSKRCIELIGSCPASVLEPVVEKLQEAKLAKDLAHHWDRVAPFPKRHPTVLYHLGRLYAEGEFDEAESKPDLITVGRVMMTLTRVVSAERKGDAHKNRLRSRLTSLLTGRRALLERCFEEIERDDLAAYLQIAERGGDDFPQEIIDATLRAVSNKYPDITSKPERPFWEYEDVIYVTAAGLARQRKEYSVLVDDKIPANSKAIGNAASLGDLSENSEWEAAMEEQRNLTGRAQEMDAQLRRARLLEDVDIPPDVVAPGNRVTYVSTEGGEGGSYRLLGPWDCIEDDILNYRAPLARALLGKSVGAEVDLPGTDESIRIERIEPAL